ncbi:hypothetical protein IFR05_005459 [Cadophora sp. M221]|nr:hypothetical protein IFR05_005459 [Cadophora sp. M221]
MVRSSFTQLLVPGSATFSAVDAVRYPFCKVNIPVHGENAFGKRNLPVTVTVSACDSSVISSIFKSATSAFAESSSAAMSSSFASFTSVLESSSSLAAQHSSLLAESSASLSSAIESFSSVSASAAARSEMPSITQVSSVFATSTQTFDSTILTASAESSANLSSLDSLTTMYESLSSVESIPLSSTELESSTLSSYISSMVIEPSASSSETLSSSDSTFFPSSTEIPEPSSAIISTVVIGSSTDSFFGSSTAVPEISIQTSIVEVSDSTFASFEVASSTVQIEGFSSSVPGESSVESSFLASSTIAPDASLTSEVSSIIETLIVPSSTITFGESSSSFETFFASSTQTPESLSSAFVESSLTSLPVALSSIESSFYTAPTVTPESSTLVISDTSSAMSLTVPSSSEILALSSTVETIGPSSEPSSFTTSTIIPEISSSTLILEPTSISSVIPPSSDVLSFGNIFLHRSRNQLHNFKTIDNVYDFQYEYNNEYNSEYDSEYDIVDFQFYDKRRQQRPLSLPFFLMAGCFWAAKDQDEFRHRSLKLWSKTSNCPTETTVEDGHSAWITQNISNVSPQTQYVISGYAQLATAPVKIKGQPTPPVLILAIWSIKQYINLRHNIKIAKTINLPYIIVPFFTGTLLWFFVAPVIIPILRYGLPSGWNRKWIDLIAPFWTWYEEYKPFAEYGSDTIVTVAPGGITFHTCCPEFIRQVGERRKDFQKPLELYSVLNTFGPNLVSTNGDEWRHQRKVMLPSFNDAHNSLVWSETIFQTKCMLRVWSTKMHSMAANRTLNFHDDLRALAFNVVSRGSFGVRMMFPGSEDVFSSRDEMGIHGAKLKEGHTMKFGEATLLVVEGLKWLFVLPRWFLRYSPYKYFRQVWLGFKEMGTYLDEYITNKQPESSTNKDRASQNTGGRKDLLNSLIENNMQSSSIDGLIGLTQQQIIGNVFNSLTAGHETTGSTLFHCMINLALHPTWQRKVQADIDTIFGDLDTDQWLYKDHLEKLKNSSLDATILETLRLYTPNNLVPKHSVERAGFPKILKHGDFEVNIPADSRINILMISVHRNPNYWRNKASSTSQSDADMALFKPERWFVTPFEAEEVYGRALPLNPIFAGSAEAQSGNGFFKPERGAFIPWSIGNRECIGRQFAHTEMLVALAIIFRDWSVELVVDNAGAGAAEKGMAWEAASEKAKKNLREGMTHYSLMQLRRGLVPLRIVKRKK